MITSDFDELHDEVKKLKAYDWTRALHI